MNWKYQIFIHLNYRKLQIILLRYLYRNKRKKIYNFSLYKRDAFKFHIVGFPFLDSNIPTKPVDGVYISQLVRIGRICGQYEDFKNKNLILTTRLLKQSYKYDQLCSYFKRFSNKYKDILGCHLSNIINKDSIPLPLSTMGRLNRLVTVR